MKNGGMPFLYVACGINEEKLTRTEMKLKFCFRRDPIRMQYAAVHICSEKQNSASRIRLIARFSHRNWSRKPLNEKLETQTPQFRQRGLRFGCDSVHGSR